MHRFQHLNIYDSALALAGVVQTFLYYFYGSAYFDFGKTAVLAGPADVLISWLFPICATILFWLKKQATPGKMVFSAKVVDARTGKALSVRQSLIRYLGYVLSAIPLGLGLIWVAYDKKKQGWHDKMAGTVVIRPKKPQ